MNNFFGDRRKFTMALGAFFLAITILAGSFGYFAAGLSPLDGDEAPVVSTPEPDAPDPSLPVVDLSAKPEPEVPETVHYNIPSEMRGVYLTPGTDFITSKDTSESTIRAEIDKAIKDAKALTMNTVIIDTVYGDSVIYQTAGAPELSSDFDIMAYVVEKAREAGFYTYAIFDASHYAATSGGTTMLAAGSGSVNTLSTNLKEFAGKYEVDGILIDGYLNTQTPQSYSAYTLLGSAMGYDNFMRETPQAVVKTAANTIRKYAKGTQIGLLADAVWANDTENEAGSATKASFTSLTQGNADTRAFVLNGIVDFVAVKAYGSTTDAGEPFEAVVKWWADVSREAGVPMYAVHASGKVCTEEPGWSSQDQLVRQVIATADISGVNGSIFNNLSRLVADPKQATTTLIKYYQDEVVTEHILSELEVTKPEKTTYTTNEPVVTFTGASDPNFPVTVNGETITTDASGYFTVTKDLKGGENTFTISHKDKTIAYTITREIEILRDIAPQGSIAAEGNMSINITAWAYEDAQVYATINGSTVQMSVDEGAEDETERDSSYKKFSGQYTTPAATSSEQSLGNIVVTATWQGQEKSIQGASVKVNKKVKIEDGVPVVVVADQAKTYPPNTLDNIPNAKYYPLPQGAMDYAVGDEIVYKKGSDTYTYVVLASQMRIESKDISSSSDYASGNAISDFKVWSEKGYTYLELKTAQKVSYSFGYGTNGISIKFHNTTAVPGSDAIDANNIFKSASWSDNNTLSLSFHKSGGFMGYKGYYSDSGTLVFRFNDPPASIKGAKIAIDPGHGGKDTGALGFLADYPEKAINKAIAALLADELEARGATVMLLDTSGGMDLQERVRQAEKFGADLFVSVHNNTASNAKASGTEVYYFYPYAQTLAASAAKNVSSQLGIANRGAKQSYYHVTLSSEVPSVLVECGFMSNKNEYEMLIKTRNQEKIAAGIADSLAATIKATATGQSVASTSGSSTANETKNSGGVSISKTSASVTKDQTLTLSLSGTDEKATWSSSDTAVATVDKNGVVTGVKAGTAKITATLEDGTTFTCTVTVKAAASSSAANAGDTIKLDKSKETVQVGKTVRLEAAVTSDNNVGVNVSWYSDDETIATVSGNGTVTGKSAGTTVITAELDNGKSASCTVTVTGSGGSSSTTDDLKITPSSVSVQVGKTTDLKASVSGVDWYSEDEDIATVTSGGRVKGISEGKVDIVAELSDGTYATCTVTVKTTGSSTGTLKITPSSASVQVGKTTDLKASVSGVDWYSDDEDIATVTSGGRVKGISEGKVDIVAELSDGTYATCTVTVKDTGSSTDDLKVTPSSASVSVGKTTDLKANVSGVEWYSYDENIATVTSKGVVRGIAEGKVDIVAELDNGDYAVCTVTVKESSGSGSYYGSDGDGYRTMKVGDTETLSLLANSEDAAEYGVTWYSSDDTIATVDKNGKVKAVKEGDCTIHAVIEETGEEESCQIFVDKKGSALTTTIKGKGLSGVTDIKLSDTSLKLYKDDTYELTVSDYDTGEQIKNTEFIWESSKPSVVRVDYKGVVRAVASTGSATIYVYTDDDEYYASCSVTVTNQVTTITSLSLNKTHITVAKGETYSDLKAIASPAVSSNRELTWKAENSVVTVDSSGKITGQKVGETTVTVTSKNGLKATCTVEVVPKLRLEYIEFSFDELEMYVGEEDFIPFTLDPENSVSSSGLEWKSSNPKAVTVDQEGNITAVGRGVATITLRSTEYRSVEPAECVITVLNP